MRVIFGNYATLALCSLIIICEACFPLGQPGFYAPPPMSYGGSGGYGAPYASRARALAPSASGSNLRMAGSVDGAVDYDNAPQEQNYDSGSSTRYSNSNDRNDDGTGCSHRFVDRRLSCATPIETRTPVSAEADCRRVCVDYFLSRCASYRYDSVASTCELYDMIPPLPVGDAGLSGAQYNAPTASGFRGEDSDLFPFRDDVTAGEEDQDLHYPSDATSDQRQPQADYGQAESTNVESSSPEAKQRRNRRFTFQNGVPSAIPSTGVGAQPASGGLFDNLLLPAKSDPNGLDAILKLPGLLPTAGAPTAAPTMALGPPTCTPSMASEPGSVYATVDVPCYRKAWGNADPLAPLVAQIHENNKQLGRALAPLAKQLAAPSLPGLGELLAAPQQSQQQQQQSQQLQQLLQMPFGQQQPKQQQMLLPFSQQQQQQIQMPQLFAAPKAPATAMSIFNAGPSGSVPSPAQAFSGLPIERLSSGSSGPSGSTGSLGPLAGRSELSGSLSGMSAPSGRYRSSDSNSNGAAGDPLRGALVIPEMPDCADGSRARIQVIDGISVIGGRPLATVRLSSAETCLHICRANAHLDGTRFARVCRAAAFDRAAGNCALLDDAITPNGDFNYTPSAQSVYFEKFCIPESELPAGCEDVVQRIPQHTLDARATGTGAVLTAATQTDCLRRCLSAQKRLGFECSSASFYFDWERANCFLSRFTRLSRPDLYVGEHKQLVDYLELAPCMKRVWQQDAVSPAERAAEAAAEARGRAPADPFTTELQSESETGFSGASAEEPMRLNIRRAPPRTPGAGAQLVNGVSMDSVRQQDANRRDRNNNNNNNKDDNNNSRDEHKIGAKALAAGTALKLRDAVGAGAPSSANEPRTPGRPCAAAGVKARDVGEAKQESQSLLTSSRSAKTTSIRPAGATSEEPDDPSATHEARETRQRPQLETSDEMTNSRGCNPRTRCCSKVTRFGGPAEPAAASGSSGGCAAIGYRVLGDGTTVACMPDDC